MATEYYNYGREADVASKHASGMWSGGYQYTTNAYFNAIQAGTELGVATHNVEVVLKFEDDGGFRPGPDVAATPNRGFLGGGTQYSHTGRPKPVAVRKINETQWTPL